MPQPLPPQPHRLDRMLGACDPTPTGAYSTSGIETALDVIGNTIVSLPRRESRRTRRHRLRRPRTAILIAAVLASLAGGTAAATRLFVNTHTHTYPPKWAIVGAGPGEILTIRATNFRQVAFGMAKDIPYPSGYASWRNWVVPMETTDSWRIPSGQLHGEFAMSAICAWVLDWRQASLTGDQARAAHAAAVLSGALQWRAVTAWDPHPRVSVSGDMGSHHPSTFGWAIPYIAAVRAGDLARVDALLTDQRFNANFHGFDPAAWPTAERVHFGVRAHLPYPSWLDRP